MIGALLILAGSIAEPPPMVITEAQRMAIVETINKLREEAEEAEARARYWHQEAIKNKKTCI